MHSKPDTAGEKIHELDGTFVGIICKVLPRNKGMENIKILVKIYGNQNDSQYRYSRKKINKSSSRII